MRANRIVSLSTSINTVNVYADDNSLAGTYAIALVTYDITMTNILGVQNFTIIVNAYALSFTINTNSPYFKPLPVG